MADYWAYCDPCGRWFYPEGGHGRAPMGTPPCPVCSTEATRVSDQPRSVAADPSTV